MTKRNNWKEFKKILDTKGIRKLYHFTDRDNLEAIINNGGLYSWKDCEYKGISIPKPGGVALVLCPGNLMQGKAWKIMSELVLHGITR